MEDSNSINVSVATNAAYGYTLSANVGDDIHNNSNLTHSNNTNVFSSIAIDADLSSLDEDEDTNIWGYSYKDNTAELSAWSNYNGLSSSSNAILLDNSNAADSTGGIDFKIAAKAGDAQPSGEYTNTINFIAVSKVAPMSLLDSFIASGAEQLNGYFKMQDMTHDICEAVDVEESELQLIDVRDNKVYWVAKLKDGNCWMTQNLDLDLSPDRPLTSNDTDINVIYDPDIEIYAEYNEGYNDDGEIVSWMPANTTRNYKTGSGTEWQNSDNMAYSLDPGNYYWDGDYAGTTDCNYLSIVCSHFSHTPYNNNGTHGHVGNYYNWPATVASNNNPVSLRIDVLNSICPKGWRLPSIINGEFKTLNNLYSDSLTIGDENIINFPLWLVRTGYFYSGSLGQSGYLGRYYSSSNFHVHYQYFLYFGNSFVDPAQQQAYKSLGYPMRCLAR